MQKPFAKAALPLLAAGYSPVPIVPRTKRPALVGWQRFCDAPMARNEVKHFARSRISYGVGVALGQGLVAIDIDTTDEAVVAAIRSVVPESPIAKHGRKGRTDFYLDKTKTVRARKFSSDLGMLVEILAHGNQTIVPPSLHPDTDLPYGWLGPESLESTQLNQLPVIVADVADRLASVLTFWRAKSVRSPPEMPPARVSDLSESDRQRRYAEVILSCELKTLGAMAINSGRNCQVFRLVCRVGRWVHAGNLSADRLTAGILNACLANGLVCEDGAAAVLATVESALRKSANDTLPKLDGYLKSKTPGRSRAL